MAPPAALIHNGDDRSPGPFAGLGALIGLASTLIVGTVLAVVFAATLAVVVLTAGALFFLTALAVRVGRPRQRPLRADQGVVLEARKVGHRWVAYGWDGRSR
jgi:uncharacterized protein (DUF58 family)